MDVAIGISDMHKSKVVHKDIKLSNILIRGLREGKYDLSNTLVILSDLGISNENNETIFEQNCGFTINFVSPENIILGLQSRKYDVWSLGCMIF